MTCLWPRNDIPEDGASAEQLQGRLDGMIVQKLVQMAKAEDYKIKYKGRKNKIVSAIKEYEQKIKNKV